jgi:hypothetical protein
MASDFCITLIGIGVSCGMTTSAFYPNACLFRWFPAAVRIALSEGVLLIRGNNVDDGNQKPSDSLHSPIPRQLLWPKVMAFLDCRSGFSGLPCNTRLCLK